MLKRLCLILVLIGLPLTARADGPAAIVDALHAGIKTMLAETSGAGFQARVDHLCPLLDDVMAVRLQSARTIGARAWNGWTAEQRDAYEAVYRDYLCALYAARFDMDAGQSFHKVGERAGPRNTLLVLTEVRISGEEPVAINYVMQDRDGAWQIVDLFLDGTVSEVALRRSEFSSILRDRGFDELLTAMAGKSAARARDSDR